MRRYPSLTDQRTQVEQTVELLAAGFESGRTLFSCGNGGSAADAEHLTGELAKSFQRRRPLPPSVLRAREAGRSIDDWAEKLEAGLPAISLCSNGALISAILNDIGADYIFAQQLVAFGKPNDMLLAISTSGCSPNVLMAAQTARILEMHVVALTGRNGGTIEQVSDVTIRAPADCAADIQEFHLPLYHALCAELEDRFFP